MKIHAKSRKILKSTLIAGSLLAGASAFADTTTTTTVTHPDGTTETTTVEETTATEAQESTPASETRQPNLIGPAGATGVIRRSDRRQDRRAGDPRID